MQRTRATLQLTRPSSSILAFLSVAVPVFIRTKDLASGVEKAAPLLFGAMCTYILNDLDDLDKDRVNHPNRPLPSGQVTPVFVVTLYYVCLALALLTTRFYVTSTETAFWYYAGFAACISYRYVVEYLPVLKPAYVAATTTIPVIILITYYPADTAALAQTGVAVFLSMIGREMCKDLPDRLGDPQSVLHRFEPVTIARVGFVAQFLALTALLPRVRAWPEAAVMLTMALVLSAAYFYWFHAGRTAIALALMKVIVLLGLYFLL